MAPTTTTLSLLSLITPLVSAVAAWYEPTARPSPDSGINVTGAPFTQSATSRLSGFVDAHNHIFSNEAFGGRLVCGKPFSPHGVADALQDCPEHRVLNGSLALFDHITKPPGEGFHDPSGWPQLADWPAHDSQTHQMNYYAWIERAWRGGLRVLVNQLVNNRQICEVYPFKELGKGCDEMKSLRLQAKRTHEMEAFVDQMFGGAGKGWFRVVKSSEEARRVVAEGKLAVVLGVETSEPFGCRMRFDRALCDKEDIDKGLDELYSLGVRSMFLCHKFDNALCGVRFDEGTLGAVINLGQFLSSGTWWQTEKCLGPQQDNDIGLLSTEGTDNFMTQALPPGIKMPDYSKLNTDGSPQCNKRGLTTLGEYAVREMMKRGMMIEIDHMSVKATARVLDILEAENYPGILSSHSWMDLDWAGRVYQLGGFIAQYMHDALEFITEAAETTAVRDAHDVGYGFGTDMNGLGSWPAPRNSSPAVEYPFTSVDGGSVIDRLTTGERTWDFTVDGAANYGLVPDWIEDIRLSGGQPVIDELFRGAESYLSTWAGSESFRSQTPTRLSRVMGRWSPRQG